MWSRCLYLESSGALPQFRLVNDADEYILDGRIRLVGWKYAIEEIDEATLQDFKRKSNGRLTFRIIPTSGLPKPSMVGNTNSMIAKRPVVMINAKRRTNNCFCTRVCR